MKHQNAPKRFMIGLTILMVGGALLLRSLGIYDHFIDEYIFRWEMILIGIGVISLFSHEGVGPGFFFVLIGGGLYARNYFDLPFGISFWQLVFAVVLIFAGIMIIFRRKTDMDCSSRKCSKDSDPVDYDTIDEIAVFGGGDRNIVTDNFRGGKFLAVFGGSNIDLSGSKLGPGKNYIDVLAVFGGFKLVVPEDWNVKIKANSIFGGFTDKHRIHTPEKETADQPELIIKGFLIFGGGEIRS